MKEIVIWERHMQTEGACGATTLLLYVQFAILMLDDF